MKALITTVGTILIVSFISCTKNHFSITDNYSSINDFFEKNSVPVSTYNIDARSGGSFTTAQGTTVTIPANAFITESNTTVTGNVIIQFKDIYQKSDMLLSNMPTETYYGYPLKSGGEFFIKATSNNSAVDLDSGKEITVTQPANLTGGLDTVNKQTPFVLVNDSLGKGWAPAPTDSIFISSSFASTSAYVFGLYQFSTPVDSGTWCNSDNMSYFSAYTMTNLILLPNDSVNEYSTTVFLLFRNLNSMVHVYYDQYSGFPYYYAPQGLPCTLVALGVKNGTLYSSFVPITITANETVSFTLSKTNTNEFDNKLKSLD